MLPDLAAWRDRPLEEVYTVVWVDALRVNSRQTGVVKKHAVYLVMGMNAAGE
ncbi:MAG: IS256 family transposase, partial [Deltaproteobacteria bacterium]|nr:IS256 family transposase [Deltaproteobacteria bacterium]